MTEPATQISIPSLETARLRLRAPKFSDLDTYANFRASDRSRSVGGPFGRESAMSAMCGLIGHWHLRGFGRWMIADKVTDEPLGTTGPFFPEEWPEPEIAWTVFGSAEGKGIAFEAATAARKFAYDTLGWTTAISMVSPENARSLALAERMGAQHEGDFDHPVYGILGIFRHPSAEALT